MISNKEKDILDALKKKLLETEKVTEDDFFNENERETPKCIYYLRRFEKNVLANKKHSQDFEKGRGGELIENKRWHLVPMASLRSSAALAWNIFGDEKKCQINQAWNLSAGDYELDYEWNESETIRGHFANLDARLHCGNCYLFVEMKMLEPLVKSHPFKSIDKYLEDGACPKQFQDAFRVFSNDEPQFFDAFQMLKHLLAIYNYFNDKKSEFKDRQKVVLLNCHWEPSEIYIHNQSYSNRTISLEKTYLEFNNTAKRFLAMKDGKINFKSLFDNINVDLELAVCNHRVLLKNIGKENNEYLKRYNI